MSYKRVMVPLDLGPCAADRVAVAASLACRFSSTIIGIAAQQPFVPAHAKGAVADKLIASEVKRVDDELVEVERVFRSNAEHRSEIEWRCSSAQDAAPFVLEQARVADILVVTRQGRDDPQDWHFGINPGAIVVGLGRPILVAPPGVKELSTKRAVVAWKDTREARRAVWDALPLLKHAEDVLVVSVSESAYMTGAVDLADYLGSHGVSVRPMSRNGRVGSVADEILSVIQTERADLLVAGAYGHAGVSEWIFGGVTRDLLDHTPVCSLLTH